MSNYTNADVKNNSSVARTIKNSYCFALFGHRSVLYTIIVVRVRSYHSPVRLWSLSVFAKSYHRFYNIYKSVRVKLRYYILYIYIFLSEFGKFLKKNIMLGILVLYGWIRFKANDSSCHEIQSETAFAFIPFIGFRHNNSPHSTFIRTRSAQPTFFFFNNSVQTNPSHCCVSNFCFLIQKSHY